MNNKLMTSKTGGYAFATFICIYLFVTFFGQALCLALFPDGGKSVIAISSCFSALSLLIVCGLIFKRAKSDISIFSVKKFNPKYILSAAALAFGMLFGLGFINDAFSKFIEMLGGTVADTVIPLDSVGDVCLFVFLLALLPAVFEELFFRGVMVNALKKTGVLFTVLAVACCFSLYHCSVAQLIYQLIYGTGLTLLVLCSGSVLPCVFAHFLNNATILILTYLKVEINFYNPLCIVLSMLPLIAFFTLRILEVKRIERLRKNEDKLIASEISKQKLEFWFPYAIFGCLICASILISALFVG